MKRRFLLHLLSAGFGTKRRKTMSALTSAATTP
jgi:hypothetical protein